MFQPPWAGIRAQSASYCQMNNEAGEERAQDGLDVFNSYHCKIWREKNIKLNISFNIIKIVKVDVTFGNKLILQYLKEKKIYLLAFHTEIKEKSFE